MREPDIGPCAQWTQLISAAVIAYRRLFEERDSNVGNPEGAKPSIGL